MRTGTNRISKNDYVFAEQNVEEMAVEGDIFLADLSVKVHQTNLNPHSYLPPLPPPSFSV